VNPVYIGALLVMFLVMSLYLLNSSKSALAESKKSFKETQKIANQIKGLKDAYANEVVAKKNLVRLLANNSFKSAGIKAEYKNNGVDISSNNMNKQALDLLMGKVLNSSYDIRALKIKKLSDNIAQVEMEIRW
jgi:hypothetical protein